MEVDGMPSIPELPSNFNQYPQTSTSTVCIWAVGDTMPDISLPVRLYRKMCVVTLKRWKAFQRVMLYMDIQFCF